VKQNVSPAVLISVLAVVFIIVGVIIVRIMAAPSSVPVTSAATKEMRNPHSGGGPTEEDLKKMREYNAAHPGARSNYR